ncbi:MAG: hypothetical protein HYY57_05290 [Candidatus Omnitrophica bacterium]|nr:hypothetical protein [Candidatus Omnitrophota bacterium]
MNTVTVVLPTLEPGDGLIVAVESLREYAGLPIRVVLYDVSAPNDPHVRQVESLDFVTVKRCPPTLSLDYRYHLGVMEAQTEWALVTHADLEFIDYFFLADLLDLASTHPDVKMIGAHRLPYFAHTGVFSRGGLWTELLLVHVPTYKKMMEKYGAALQLETFTEEFPIRMLHAMNFENHAFAELPPTITSKYLHRSGASRRAVANIPKSKAPGYARRLGFAVFQNGVLKSRLNKAPWRLRRKRPHVIWGADTDAREAIRRLRQAGIPIRGVVMPEPWNWNEQIEGLAILSPDQLFDPEDAYVVITTNDYAPVAQMLIESGFSYIDDFIIFRTEGHSFHSSSEYLQLELNGNPPAAILKNNTVWRSVFGFQEVPVVSGQRLLHQASAFKRHWIWYHSLGHSFSVRGLRSKIVHLLDRWGIGTWLRLPYRGLKRLIKPHSI